MQVTSSFLKLQRSARVDDIGLVMMDDGGSSIEAQHGLQDRQTWIAVLIPPFQSQYAITQMDGLQDELMKQFGAAELHAYEIFQKAGCWEKVSTEHLKAVVAAVAEVLRSMKFPIIVQTLWKGNESHQKLVKMGTGKDLKSIEQGFTMDIRSPKDAAFVLCIYRCRDYIEDTFPGTKWEFFADAGKRKPGETMIVPIRWSDSALIRVHFEDSKICRLIQLADFAAYFLNRSQQIAHSKSRNIYDEELLDILGTGWNFVNIDYEARSRQHPV